MENSILYTFSTLAQALGGAFALLSAFVLFRFQSLDASMLNASNEAVRPGDTVCMLLRPGALGVAWSELGRCDNGD
jgi:hypothetical protein